MRDDKRKDLYFEFKEAKANGISVDPELWERVQKESEENGWDGPDELIKAMEELNKTVIVKAKNPENYKTPKSSPDNPVLKLNEDDPLGEEDAPPSLGVKRESKKETED